ncbi:MAG: pyridoxal phosphate-dependent aminotransferase [Armatimonadota bacterium]
MKISQCAARITPSSTLAITAKAKAMKAEGIDVVGFGAGEPDFDTPAHIGQAAKQAIDDGQTKYTSGVNELKSAIRESYQRDLGLGYETTQICVGVGAKHVLHTACQALCDPGDEVIIFAPYWVSYPEMIRMTGAEPKVVECAEANGFVPELADVEKAITDRTVAIMLNSPSNPTGAVFPDETVGGLADLAIQHDLLLISDECYDRIVFDGLRALCPATISDAAQGHSLVVNAASKAYSMTGWRVGWGCGPTDLIKAMNSYISHETSNPCSIAELAAAEGLLGSQDCVREMCAAFEERRDYVVERIAAIPGLTLARPQGAFYAFPNVSAHYGRELGGSKVEGSAALCGYLLEEAKVAAVPGDGFGADDFLRISFATSMEQLEKGLDRIEKALA